MNYQHVQHFDSFEQLNGYDHGWDGNLSTAVPEQYAATIKQTVAQGLLVNTFWFSSPTLQQASTPVGMRTFALPLTLSNPYCWRGLPVNERTFMVFPTDRELFSIMGANSEVLTISIDQRMADNCLLGWGVEPETVFNVPRAQELSNLQCEALKKKLGLVTEFMVEYGDHRQFTHLSRGIQEHLIENMLKPFAESSTGARISDAFAARRIKAAADYILCHLGEPLTVRDVCEEIGCSQRSLEKCFRKLVGTTPKQFIQFMRFKHCRDALLAAEPGRTVSQIAGQNGFWHMGQFSKTYRRMFGETPSQTLGRF